MHVERLTKLQLLLEERPRRPIWSDSTQTKRLRFESVIFDLSRWVNSCHTAACAAGLYALNYPRDGLVLTPRSIEYELPNVTYSGFDAVERFFELDSLKALRLKDAHAAEDTAFTERRSVAHVDHEIVLTQAIFAADYYWLGFGCTEGHIKPRMIAKRVGQVLQNNAIAGGKWPIDQPIIVLEQQKKLLHSFPVDFSQLPKVRYV